MTGRHSRDIVYPNPVTDLDICKWLSALCKCRELSSLCKDYVMNNIYCGSYIYHAMTCLIEICLIL